MRRLPALLLILTSCNRWIRGTPPPPVDRSPTEQRSATVRVDMTCAPFADDPFDDMFVDDPRANEPLDGGAMATAKSGAGCMVSEWQVLTALHVVECTAAIPTITVTALDGRRWHFSPEKEWRFGWPVQGDGIARLQISSADSLRSRLRPPVVSKLDLGPYEPVYIQTPEATKLATATGWEYGNDDDGHVVTYRPDPVLTIKGDSGSCVYDVDGALVGVHLGELDPTRAAARVTEEMVP